METCSNENGPVALRSSSRDKGAWRKSRAARVAYPKEAAGGGVKLLTIDGSGWHYSRVGKILDAQKFKAAPLQVWEPGDGTEASLVMMGMARGSSTTDGYHELGIPRAVP